MANHATFNLRYIGVIPQQKCMEYGFRVEEKDKDPRLIVLMIQSVHFKQYALMFQEAPDLCYQKLLSDIQNETIETPLEPRVAVTEADITRYREGHPTARTRRAGGSR